MRLVTVSILVALLVGCVGCGAKTEIDGRLVDSITRYLRNAPNEGKLDDVSAIKLGDPGDGDGGACNLRELRGVVFYREVVISENYESDNAYWDAVVAHELAHCLHDLDHADEGLMNPDLDKRPSYWDENLDQAIQDLF